MKATLLLLCAAFGAACLPASGQSAGNFEPEDLTERVATEASAENEEKMRSELLERPSRYVGLDHEAYVQTMEKSLSMRGRTFDPFGRHQDPNFEPPKPAEPSRAVPTFKPVVIPFSDIIAGIRVTMVMPAEQAFLVGERSFRVGDRINLNSGAKLLPVHVVSVSSNSVRLRNGETNEVADISLNLMPQGMSRGTDITPPGMVPTGANAPLVIESPAINSASR